MKLYTRIGLEIHILVFSNQKSFSKTPVNETSWISLGFPGTLPQINFEAIRKSIILASTLNMELHVQPITFDRKNYFYYDLPRGYQITQFFNPIGTNGHILLSNNKKIRIKQIHLEEDTAKQTKKDNSIELSFKRLGAPLFEVVTEADFTTFEEVEEFLSILRSICIFTDVSSCKYEKGEMRVDLNISLQTQDTKLINPKQEIKNLNSLASINKSISFQETELAKAISNNEEMESYTYSWNDKLNVCTKERKKGKEQEYLYIPESNIPPIYVSDEEKNLILNQNLSYEGFINELKDSTLSSKETKHLLSDYEFFKRVLSLNKALNNWKKSYIWVANLVESVINDLPEQQFSFDEVIKLILHLEDKNSQNSKLMIKEIIQNNLTAEESVKMHAIVEITNEKEILDLIHQVLKDNDDQLEKLSKNLMKLEKFVLGELMKKTKGRINPQISTKIFKENIECYLYSKKLNLN